MRSGMIVVCLCISLFANSSDLLDAAESCRVESMRQAIERGAELNAVDRRHRTALHLAADRGCPEGIELLIKHGAIIDSRDEQRRTPLMTAVKEFRSGRRDAYRQSAALLLEAGADIDSQSRRDESVMQHALNYEHDEDPVLFAFLLSHNPDMSVRDINGHSVLYRALEETYEKLADLLIEHGAPLDTDYRAQELFDYLIEKDMVTITEHFIHKGYASSKITMPGSLLLMRAIDNRSPQMVDLLLKHGADPDARFEKNLTPLMAAARKGNLAVLNRLLRETVDPNVINEYGMTALAYALEEQFSEGVEALAAGGADPNLGSLDSKPLLVYAFKYRDISTIRSLLKYKADTAPVLSRGASLLISAINSRQTEKIKLLKALGVDMNAAADRDTPLTKALRKNIETVKLLLELGANPNQSNGWGETPLMAARGSLPMIRELVRYGADVNAVDAKGRHLGRHLSCNRGLDAIRYLHGQGMKLPKNSDGVLTLQAFNNHVTSKECIDYLLNEGAEIDGIDSDMSGKNTPMLVAVNEGHTDIALYLIEKGADIHYRNTYGMTALHYAAMSRAEDVIKALLERGADIMAKDQHGRTPLTEIAKFGDETLIFPFIAKLPQEELNPSLLSWARQNRYMRIAEYIQKHGNEKVKQ